MLEIRNGSMDNGKRRILNSDSATKTLSAVNGSSLVATNVPNVAKATLRIDKKTKENYKNASVCRVPLIIGLVLI